MLVFIIGRQSKYVIFKFFSTRCVPLFRSHAEIYNLQSPAASQKQRHSRGNFGDLDFISISICEDVNM